MRLQAHLLRDQEKLGSVCLSVPLPLHQMQHLRSAVRENVQAAQWKAEEIALQIQHALIKALQGLLPQRPGATLTSVLTKLLHVATIRPTVGAVALGRVQDLAAQGTAAADVEDDEEKLPLVRSHEHMSAHCARTKFGLFSRIGSAHELW